MRSYINGSPKVFQFQVVSVGYYKKNQVVQIIVYFSGSLKQPLGIK